MQSLQNSSAIELSSSSQAHVSNAEKSSGNAKPSTILKSLKNASVSDGSRHGDKRSLSEANGHSAKSNADLSAALATHLQVGKLSFATADSSSLAATAAAVKQANATANSKDEECLNQWQARVSDLMGRYQKLTAGRMQLNKVQVLLEAVDAAKWPALFSGVPEKAATSPESGAKVQQAVDVLNKMMGQLNGIGETYTGRLQEMVNQEQKSNFMKACLKKA
jgi:hypothetical protein